ncbi:hypothetical protein G6F35_017392 [Rhizopus arrhizus]|nr:hypothetical protein G6F35_017392 [Rhizopus arrhizus]
MGMTDKEKIKFVSKDTMIADWVATFRETKGPEVAEQEWRKTALNGASGQVLMIGLAFDDADPVVAHASTETETLAVAFDMIRQARCHHGCAATVGYPFRRTSLG